MSDEEQPEMEVDEEELFGAAQPIAPLSPLRQEDTSDWPRQNNPSSDAQAENQTDAGEKKDEGKAKRVRKPRVVLNEERLIGKNGIRKLPELFKKVKFKGKGSEKEDLDVLLKEMEHWAHIMIPRQQFADVIDKLELLGTKKLVKGHARHVQSGIPLMDNDERDVVAGLDHDDAGGNENENIGQTSPQIYNELANNEPTDDINALLNEDFGDVDL